MKKITFIIFAILIFVGGVAFINVIDRQPIPPIQPVPSKPSDNVTVDTKEVFFQDGFEGVERFENLFQEDLTRWHNFQRKPEENRIEVNSSIVHSGNNSLMFHTVPYDGKTASKADVDLQLLSFKKEDDVWFSGWFYLVGNGNAENLFLWDLEATETHPQAPGRRIYLSGKEEIISDLGKWYTGEVFRQPKKQEIPFSKDKWVHIKIHLFLSENDDGIMQVWQDDVMVLDARGQTLPTADSIYNRMQVGITANGNREYDQTVYIDDIILSDRPI